MMHIVLLRFYIILGPSAGRALGPTAPRGRRGGNDTGWQNILRKGDIVLTGKQSVEGSSCEMLRRLRRLSMTYY
jgi:hypothetical protein